MSTLERLCLAMGMANRAFTQYLEYDFNSFARLRDTFMAANEEGLYILGGDTDDGEEINASFSLRDTDFGDFTKKRILRVHLGLEAGGDVMFGFAPDKGAFTYRVVTDAGSDRGPWVNFDGAVRGRYFQFKLGNLDGSWFALDSAVVTTAGKRRINLFTGSTGLQTRVDMARIPYDPETGMHAMATALNVDVDPSGRVSRRKGYTKAQPGSFHSLFCAGGQCLVVQEHPGTAALYRVSEDGSLKGVRSGLTKGARMGYHALNGMICYSNGHENGVYLEGAETSTPWVMGDIPAGLKSDAEFCDPPVARHISSMGLHMILADSEDRRVLWCSHQGAFNAFRLDDGHITFEHPITMVKAVQDGLWVGTEGETLFLSGVVPEEWAIARRLPERVKEYSASQLPVPSHRMGLQDIQGEGFIWVSDRGLCWGGPAGQHVNLSEPFIDPRDFEGNKGACLVTEDKVIATIEP